MNGDAMICMRICMRFNVESRSLSHEKTSRDEQVKVEMTEKKDAF